MLGAIPFKILGGGAGIETENKNVWGWSAERILGDESRKKIELCEGVHSAPS